MDGWMDVYGSPGIQNAFTALRAVVTERMQSSQSCTGNKQGIARMMIAEIRHGSVRKKRNNCLSSSGTPTMG